MDEFRQGVDDTTINHGLLKLLKFSQNSVSLLSCVDVFSKWFEVLPTAKVDETAFRIDALQQVGEYFGIVLNMVIINRPVVLLLCYFWVHKKS